MGKTMKISNPFAKDFKTKIDNIFQSAQQNAQQYIDINSGDLHRQVGGYPGHNHRMPNCCSVMRQYMKPGDKILNGPPSGQGASLIIRYYLPR